MSVFLTPETRPFYGGTYWPPENRWGRPGFATVLLTVAEAWKNKRDAILAQSVELVAHLERANVHAGRTEPYEIDDARIEAVLHNAESSLLEIFDSRYGGFGGAPKISPLIGPSVPDAPPVRHAERFPFVRYRSYPGTQWRREEFTIISAVDSHDTASTTVG